MRHPLAIAKDDVLDISTADEPGQTAGGGVMRFKVLRKTSTGWQCQNLEDGTLRSWRHGELNLLVAKGQVLRGEGPSGPSSILTRRARGAEEWHSLTPAQKERVEIKARLVTLFRKTYPDGRCTKKRFDDFVAGLAGQDGLRKKFSQKTLQNWLNKFLPNDSPVVLADEPHLGGRRFSKDVADIVHTTIQTKFLCQAPSSRKTIHEAITTKIDEQNAKLKNRDPRAPLLIAPSYPTLCRVIADANKHDVERYQKCAKAAEDKFKIYGKASWSFSAGKLVAVDNTPIDLYVIDEEGNILGRVLWTVVQCVKTGIILGWHLSLSNPSAATVVAALRHAFRPKPSMKEKFGGKIDNEFPFYGIPEGILFDNALEHLSTAVEECCRAIGILHLEFTPSYDPTKKGQIERLFKTMNVAIFHDLPGAVPYGPGDNPGYDPKENACITLPQLELLIYKYAVDIHPYLYVKRLKALRIDAWMKDFEDIFPNQPADPLAFKAMMGGTFAHRLQRQGISFMGFQYGTHEELGRLRIADGARNSKFQCRFDPDDLTSIQVLDPATKSFITATAQDSDVHGQTLLQREAALIRQNCKKAESDRLTKRAKAELRAMKKKASKPARRAPSVGTAGRSSDAASGGISADARRIDQSCDDDIIVRQDGLGQRQHDVDDEDAAPSQAAIDAHRQSLLKSGVSI